jgi:beta-carotene hydroxylase
MRLRFVEDRRTLVWAFVLFPLGPALALWRPGLLPWLAPLLLYCSYLSGVLTHNHNHCGVFRQRWANLGYGAWLSIFYGFPIFSWIPTHNQNHHRFRNGHGDMTATARHAEHDSLLAALSYPPASSRYQLPALAAFVCTAFRSRSRQRSRIVLEPSVLLLAHAAVFRVAVLCHGLGTGTFVYFFALGLPALLGTYWMMLTNYLQHVGCDPASEHDHSRNFVSPFFNWFVFENGLHTVHHEHPGLHWSRYRELHRRREGQIAPELNQSTLLGFAFRRYVSRARSVAAVAAERSSSPAR